MDWDKVFRDDPIATDDEIRKIKAAGAPMTEHTADLRRGHTERLDRVLPSGASTATLAPMKTARLPRPYCRRIEPEGDPSSSTGYYCQNCGYSLVETRTGWFRHGDVWVKPAVWTNLR